MDLRGSVGMTDDPLEPLHPLADLRFRDVLLRPIDGLTIEQAAGEVEQPVVAGGVAHHLVPASFKLVSIFTASAIRPVFRSTRA